MCAMFDICVWAQHDCGVGGLLCLSCVSLHKFFLLSWPASGVGAMFASLGCDHYDSERCATESSQKWKGGKGCTGTNDDLIVFFFIFILSKMQSMFRRIWKSGACRRSGYFEKWIHLNFMAMAPFNAFCDAVSLNTFLPTDQRILLLMGQII